MNTSLRLKSLVAIVATFAFASPTLGGDPAGLRKCSPCGWETEFRQGTVGCAPHGSTRGTVLYADGKTPRLSARMQGMAWKGKDFHCDGTFTNRWIGGVRAVSTDIHVEPSWLDGEPCFVMQYAADARVFGNVRDELREICPNVWLGRSYDACTREPKNWFVLCGN